MIPKSLLNTFKFSTKLAQHNKCQSLALNIKQLHKIQRQNFGRAVRVKVPGFKSKLSSQSSPLENQEEDNEKNQQNEQTQNNMKEKQKQEEDDVTDFRDIELTSEQNEYKEETTLQEQEIEDSQPFSKDQLKYIRDSLLYKGDDPYPEKLIHRPEKGVVWGLGGELMKKKLNFFTPGQWPTPEEVMGFLEMEQAKDIELIDTELQLNRTDLSKYIICLSTYSCVHNYKIAKNLLKAVKALNVPLQTRKLQISGRRDDEWVMVDFGDIAVHLFVEESREEIGLEYKLFNPPTDEDVDEYLKIANSQKKQSVFEPLKDI